MKKNNQNGTAILIVILVTSILLVSLTILWRSASLSYESATLYYKTKKNFYANESLIIYGIAILKTKTYDKLILNTKDTILYNNSWPLNSMTWGKLTMSYDQKSKQTTLLAMLFNDDHLEPILKTQVICQKKEKIVQIINWQDN